jgi:sugar lactone lactonase YvrE
MDGTHPLLRSGLGLFREAIAPVAESIWWGPDDSLYWCNSLEGTIHISPLGSPVTGVSDRILRVPPILAAFAPAPDGYVIAGANAVAVVNPLGGFVRTLSRIPHATEQIRFNEGKCDPYGRLILGTTGIEGFSTGSIYSVEPSGQWRSVFDGAGLVTGVQWSDDASRMWFTDTRLSTIFACDYTPGGDIRNVLPFVRGVRGEGLARDVHGGFWTSGGGGRIVRWDSSGQQTLELAVPARRVTSLAFGGPELSTLFIATSRVGMAATELSAYPLSGAIFGIETATRGYPTRPFGRP